MHTDFENAFHKEPVTFLLSNALRHLTQDQQRQLCNALLERLPVPASIMDEVERLYQYLVPSEYLSMDVDNVNRIADYKRSAHITAARQYMGEIDKLRAENEKMRKALEEMVNKQHVKVLYSYHCLYKENGGKLDFNEWLDACPIEGLNFKKA